MESLTHKTYKQYEYFSRYTNVPAYINTVDEREIFGIGSNVFQNVQVTLYDVQEGDTLDYLALKYYGNPTFWWVLAYYNNIQDPFIDLYTVYKSLKLPVITGIKFGNERAY